MKFNAGTRVRIKPGIVNDEIKDNIIDYSNKAGKIIKIYASGYKHPIEVQLDEPIVLPSGQELQTDYFSEEELEYLDGNN